jgi:hypothetical protein
LLVQIPVFCGGVECLHHGVRLRNIPERDTMLHAILIQKI